MIKYNIIVSGIIPQKKCLVNKNRQGKIPAEDLFFTLKDSRFQLPNVTVASALPALSHVSG